MKTLTISPYDGLNKRFPEQKLTSKKAQFCQELKNLICLDFKISKFVGARRYNDTATAGSVRWAKRIYYDEGGDKKRYQFTIIGNKIYRGHDTDGTITQVFINGSLDTVIETAEPPIDASLKVSGVVSTFLVDGKYYYKFNGASDGSWEQLPIKEDIDGNNIEPIYIVEYLDRMWTLVKNRNVLIGSNNLNPEIMNDATDSVLIELPPGNGGFPQSLIVHRGFLYVVHEDYIAPLSGSSPATFGVRPGDIIHGFGTRARKSVVNMRTKFAFLNSADNEWYFSSGTLDSTEKSPFSYPIKFSSLVNPTKASQTVAVLDQTLNSIRCSYVHSGEFYLDAEVIFSITEDKWCAETRGRKISCYSPWYGNGDQGEMITGRSETGLLMVEDKNEFNFDSASITVKLVTATYVVSDIGEVQFGELITHFKSIGTHSINVFYYMDTRLSSYGSNAMSAQGEVLNVGLIEIANQGMFANRGNFQIDRRRGFGIRFEIDMEFLNKDFEIYDMFATYEQMETTRFSKYIHGA